MLASEKSESENSSLLSEQGSGSMKMKLAKEHEPKFEPARERREHERVCRQCSGARRAGAAALVLPMELTHERLASKIKRIIFSHNYSPS